MRDDAYAISPGVGGVLIMVDWMHMRANHSLIYNSTVDWRRIRKPFVFLMRLYVSAPFS